MCPQTRKGTAARDWSLLQPMRGGKILTAENLIENSFGNLKEILLKSNRNLMEMVQKIYRDLIEIL